MASILVPPWRCRLCCSLMEPAPWSKWDWTVFSPKNSVVRPEVAEVARGSRGRRFCHFLIACFPGEQLGYEFSDMSARYWNRLAFERELWQRGVVHVAGVDEAGCGPLAGPVLAAAVVFPCQWRETGA